VDPTSFAVATVAGVTGKPASVCGLVLPDGVNPEPPALDPPPPPPQAASSKLVNSTTDADFVIMLPLSRSKAIVSDKLEG